MLRPGIPRALILIGLALSLYATSLRDLPLTAHASPTPQPATYYFHRQNLKVLNTISTSLWSNTTSLWSSSVQTESRDVTNVSPATWDFYSQPAFSGDITLGGLLNVTVYLSASTNTKAGTVISAQVNKITSTGTTVPLSTASLSNPVSTGIAAYTISIPTSTYVLETGSILNFHLMITVTSSGTKTILLYYDSLTSPSQTSLPFLSRMAVVSFSVLNQTGTPTTFFNRNVTAANRQMIFRAVLNDSIGPYDIASVGANITSPSGSNYLTNLAFVRIQGTSFQTTWEYNLTYSSSDSSGAYSISLALIDNSGVKVVGTDSYSLYATWELSVRTVSYPPSSKPIAGVALVVSAGPTPVYLGASNASGWINPIPVLPDNASYFVFSYWQGVLVNQTGPFSPSSSFITILLSIFPVSFSNVFRDGNGNPLAQQPSSFRLLSPNGSITQPSLSGTYLLPGGNYNISAVIWEDEDVTPAQASFDPTDGIPIFNLRIYDLTIFVTDQNDRPVPGTQVTIFRDENMVYQEVTNVSGPIVAHSLPQGQYVVFVQHQGSVARKVVNLTQSGTEVVQITTPASSSTLTWDSLTWIFLAGAIGAGLIIFYGLVRTRRIGRLLSVLSNG